jgi:hypothetical protein
MLGEEHPLRRTRTSMNNLLIKRGVRSGRDITGQVAYSTEPILWNGKIFYTGLGCWSSHRLRKASHPAKPDKICRKPMRNFVELNRSHAACQSI